MPTPLYHTLPLAAKKAVGRAIRQARLVAGISQLKLARRLRLRSNANVSRWEDGTHVPSPRTLRRIGKALGANALAGTIETLITRR